MPTGFWDSTVRNLIRILLDTETDSESPDAEVTKAQIRKSIEALFLLTFGTGTFGTATSDPSNNTNGYFYDTAGGWINDQHNGRTLLILSGLAKGNLYTIDDTVNASDRLDCTGDNLYADGVRSGDSYVILYDILSRNEGHDHDAINSPEVVLADAQVKQAKLATSTGSVNTSNVALTDLTLPGGEYGFYPQVKLDGMNTMSARICEAVSSATYVTNIALMVSAGGPCYAQQRYVTSSGEVHWVFVLRDAVTKAVLSAWQAPDHPCFGNGSDPEIVPHPFGAADLTGREILVINPAHALVLQLREQAAAEGRDLLDLLVERIDDTVEPEWPVEPVTVGLPPEWDAAWLERTPVRPVKKVIPKPDGVRTAGLAVL